MRRFQRDPKKKNNEVDYGPDSGMDDEEIAEYYPPLNNHGQLYFPYEEDSAASYLAHAHTPPVYLPMLEGVQPAGYDYHYLCLGWGLDQGDEGSQHEDPLAAPIAYKYAINIYSV